MAHFGVRQVQPIVALYVKELVGNLPNPAALAGIAFSITGLANVISAPFLGNRSDRIGYRRVLLICLAGGTLTTLPQRSEEHTSELQSHLNLVCRLLLEKKKKTYTQATMPQE